MHTAIRGTFKMNTFQPGQMRVIVLLLVLLALEIIRSPALQSFFKGTLNAPTQGTNLTTQPGG